MCFIWSHAETFKTCFCLVSGNPLRLTAKFLHKLQQVWKGTFHYCLHWTKLPISPFHLESIKGWAFSITPRRWHAKVLPGWQLCSQDDKLCGKSMTSRCPGPVETTLGTTFPSLVTSASSTSAENIPTHKAISTPFQGYSWVPVSDLCLKQQRGQG